MSVLWVETPDEAGSQSARAYIERNAIALLSNQFDAVDGASAGWLGRQSPRPEIRASGLWNLDDVKAECEVTFLDALETFVMHTCTPWPP